MIIICINIFIIYTVFTLSVIMNSNKNSIKYVLTALVILAFSTFLPAIAYAAPGAQPDGDWQYVNGNSWGWNYSPQTQINKANVNNLEVKWIFPIGSKAVAPAGIQTLFLQEGATTPPIVHKGIVYVTTNFLKTYATDAKTGKELWTHDYTFDVEAVKKNLPWSAGADNLGGLLLSHIHGIRYWEGGNQIIYEGMACDFIGIDATTGVETTRINNLCKDIPGNIYTYRPTPNSQSAIGTYDKGRQFVLVLPGGMHSTTFYGDARHVTLGISMDTKQVIWKVFSFPPQDVPTKDWALQECDIGYFQMIPCTEVAAKNKAQLEWDWAFPDQKPSPYGGVTANWGTLIVDEDTGILYTNTGNQGPYSNLTLTPGPRLYGSTLMAIDLNQGKRIWWLQPFPHDPYDYDCNWGGVLADNPTLGKVYMKGCKEGYLYIVNAATGKPLKAIDVIADQIAIGQVTAAAAGVEPKAGGARYHRTDPLSDDMRNWNFVTDGRVCPKAGCKLYPSFFNGLFATDMSYDPGTLTLFNYANAATTSIIAEYPVITGANLLDTKDYYPWNSSIIARDVATGNIKWSWFYPFSAQRAAMVVTSDIIFSGFTDGSMKFFDKDKGTLLSTVNVGSPVAVGPTIGKDSDGNSKIFLIAGLTSIPQAFGAGYGPSGPVVPGTLLALGLNQKAAAAVTSTSTTTQTSTTTVVSSVTESTGLPSEVTYAAIGIAIIAIIAAAYLTMRKRA